VIVAAASDVQFFPTFVIQRDQIADIAAILAPKARGDPVVWFAQGGATHRRTHHRPWHR
jgi:hypothetical protein